MKKIFLSIIFLFFIIGLFAQTITGKVIDETGEGLPGVNILIEGTSTGTVTDFDGTYQLNAESGATLVFSFIGYAEQQVVVGSNPIINISLLPDAQSLEEIVVTGYGQTQNKRFVSTSISTLKAEKLIKDRPIQRVEQAIQGSTPAVVVVKESGSPGAPLTIRMRGIGTAGNATPLILVNGVQVPDMNFLNPNNMQNITILKDAASSAIYGSRGGNGVILLETKKGAKSDSKRPKISLSSYYGIQSLASEGGYLNTQQYADYYNKSILYNIRQGLPVNGRSVFSEEEIAALPNTSWIDKVSEDTPIQDHYLGISGGGDKTTYYLSAGLFNQEGIIGKTDFQRLNFTGSIHQKVIEGIDINVFGTYSKNDRRFIFENSENNRLINSIASLPPIYPVYDELGNPFNNGNRRGVVVNGVSLNAQPEFGNPFVGFENTENQSKQDVAYINALLNWQVVEKLKFSTSFGYLNRENNIRSFTAAFNYPEQFIDNPINSLTESFVEDEFLQWEGYFTYDALNQANQTNQTLDVIVGTSALKNNLSLGGRNAIMLLDNTFDEATFDRIADDAVVNTIDINGDGPNEAINTTLSFYGRANYNLNEKYLFSATLRADASSKFTPDNQWGIFPSASIGWVASSEDFLKNIAAIDLLKVRASWGISGNDQIPPYQHFQRYSTLGGTLTPLDYNPDIKWEEITQTNVGIDADLFGNRIGVTLDYYIKETKDMLLNFPNPGFLGIPPPVRNAATVQNKGFEAILLYRNKIGSAFTYNIALNYGRNTNEVTDLGGGVPIESANIRVFRDAPNITRTDEGHPIASFYGLVFDGLDDAGNPIYRDLNGDGVIDLNNDRDYIGNPFPDFIYGINLSMAFKGFDLTAFVQGTQGNDVVNAAAGYHVQYSNRTDRVLDAWTLENTNTNVMRPSALEVVNHEFSNYYIEDGSYLRLKNITLGYTFPNSITSKIGIEHFRIFASGNNLFTFTDYSGLDPEIGANNNPLDVGVDRGFYPLAKSITGGVQVSF